MATVETPSLSSTLSGTTQAWAYDAAHRLKQVSGGGRTVTYGYRANTRLRDSRSLAGGAAATSYLWDDFGRLASVTGAHGTTTVAWEPGGARLASLSDGLEVEAFCYRGEGWLREVRTGTTDCGAALPSGATSRAYTYDGRGNRLTETYGGATRHFQYDSADRLTAVQE